MLESGGQCARWWLVTPASREARHILVVLTDDGYTNASLQSVAHAIRGMTADLQVLRLGSLGRRRPLHTHTGELVERVSKRAAELGVELIILPPSMRDVGTLATSLARATKAPVLIARGRVENGPVLAATDLQDPSFRVLRCGSGLAQRLQATLVTFHNVESLGSVQANLGLFPSFALPVITSPKEANYLAEVSRRLPTSATPVLRSEDDPVQSILAEADARGADVVVVGTHYRSWWGRVLSRSVASCVAARAGRSVLVTPILGPASGAHGAAEGSVRE